MSPWVTILGIIVGIVVQLIVAAYVYGKLTGKVTEHDRRHASHDTRFQELGLEQDRQWETMGHQAERISAVEARVSRQH